MQERLHTGKKAGSQGSQAGPVSGPQLVAGGSRASELTSLSIRFFICKMGIRIIILRVVVRTE